MASWPRGRFALAVAAALLLAPATGSAGPELALEAGTTLGVNGSPGSGGAGGGVALLWPFEERFAFGAVLYADDLGTALEDLFDPNTGQPLGTIAGRHRWSFGAGWRAEARLAESRRWRALWGLDFGYGRQERDVRGTVDGAVSGVLAATGPTLLWQGRGGHAIGLSAALKHAFVSRGADADRTTDWTTLTFAWRWQPTRPRP
jgi:hypothetical protein